MRKEELEWVMSQIKFRGQAGRTSLEDVLEELERGRGKTKADAAAMAAWKPSLEVITESPELHEVMDKS